MTAEAPPCSLSPDRVIPAKINAFPRIFLVRCQHCDGPGQAQIRMDLTPTFTAMGKKRA
jgi:hypothetical protein